MALPQNIAKAALKALLQSKKEPTPQNYESAYNEAAQKLGGAPSGGFELQKLCDMIEPELKAANFARNFKSKDELSIALIKNANQLFSYKKNYALQQEILRFCLRILGELPAKNISQLAKGHLLEQSKLNFNTLQVWRDRWAQCAKSAPELLKEAIEEIAAKAAEAKIAELKSIEDIESKSIESKNIESKNIESAPKIQAQNLEQNSKNTNSAQDSIESKNTQEEQKTQDSINNENFSNNNIKKENTTFKQADKLPIDPATQLISQNGMREVLNFAEDEYKKSGINYAVIFFGISKFEKLNEVYGEQAAKRVFMSLGRLLKQYSNNRDLIAYWGDSEFLCALLERQKPQTMAFVKELDKAVKESIFMFKQTRINIEISASVSYRVDCADLETMLKTTIAEFKKNKDSIGIIKDVRANS